MSRSRGIGPLEGADHPRARLTEDQVREMRRRVAAGATTADVAAWVGVGWTTAYKAVAGLTWRSIDDPPALATRATTRKRWSGDEIQYLAEHVEDGSPDVGIALGRSATAIRIKRHREEL